MAIDLSKISIEELQQAINQKKLLEIEAKRKQVDSIKKEVLELLTNISGKIAVFQTGDLKDADLFSWNDPVFSDILTVLNFPKKANKPKVFVAVSPADKEKIINAIASDKITLEAIAGEFGDTTKPFSKTSKKLKALEALNIIKSDKKRPKKFSVIA